jgi:hypothetical protein
LPSGPWDKKSVCHPAGVVHFWGMNISTGVKKLVAGATFKIPTKERGNGQCVLVEGGFIITAAHCVDWDCTSLMAVWGDYYNKIKTGSGDLTTGTLAVEPVSDIAVLGCPDDNRLPDEALAFEDWCAHIVPVKLLRRTPKARVPFPVWIRTHVETWVAGTATYSGWSYSTFSYTTDSEIPSGTSGGPIVNHAGELVGVVSHGTNCCKGKYYSGAGLLSLALPTWVIARSIPSKIADELPSGRVHIPPLSSGG